MTTDLAPYRPPLPVRQYAHAKWRKLAAPLMVPYVFVAGRCAVCTAPFVERIQLPALAHGVPVVCGRPCRRRREKRRNRELRRLRTSCPGCGDTRPDGALACDDCAAEAVRSCLTKHRYATETESTGASRQRSLPNGQVTYPCPLCRGYHRASRTARTNHTQHQARRMARMSHLYEQLRDELPLLELAARLHLRRYGLWKQAAR